MFKRQRPGASPSPQAQGQTPIRAQRHDQRVVLHFVTCNYEARRRGLYKLQLITEARKACPEVIILLGEDLTRFRNHSKANYAFLKNKIWSGQAERLGFDEVWMDVTDMIDYNVSIINQAQLDSCWFCLDQDDPTQGFSFDATRPAHRTMPKHWQFEPQLRDDPLTLRLTIGSHLAFYIRDRLEEEKGFTSTVGISTNKLLSKLVGNVNKPRGQTTLMPPYNLLDGPDENESGRLSSVQNFLDGHEIGEIPGIGHKTAQQIRSLVKGHQIGYKEGLVTHYAIETVDVRELRLHPGISPEVLEETLSGPGTPRGIGGRIWDLIHGIDDTEVSKARDVPRQISIEDTYLHLHDLKAVRQQLIQLSRSLIKRMRIDLTTDDEPDLEDDQDGGEALGRSDGVHEDGSMEMAADSRTTYDKNSSTDEPAISLDPFPVQQPAEFVPDDSGQTSPPHLTRSPPAKLPPRRWLAHPRTIRLSTRERKPQHSFARVSRSGPMPNYIFNLDSTLEALATKLADETLLGMFSKLVPGKAGFDVNLINVAATNMLEAAGEGKRNEGRDIKRMFGRQERVLREWRVEDRDVPPEGAEEDTQEVEGRGEDDNTANAVSVEDAFNGPTIPHNLPSPHKIGDDGKRNAQHEQPQTPSASIVALDSATFEPVPTAPHVGSEDAIIPFSQGTTTHSGMHSSGRTIVDVGWESDGDEGIAGGEDDAAEPCALCGALMPPFATEAHWRFHEENDGVG